MGTDTADVNNVANNVTVLKETTQITCNKSKIELQVTSESQRMGAIIMVEDGERLLIKIISNLSLQWIPFQLPNVV